MLSRSALAHIYDNVMARARISPSIGSAKTVLLRSRHTHIQSKSRIEFFCTFCSCAVGGRGDNSEAHKMPSTTPAPRSSAAAVPAIAEFGERPPLNAAEAAAFITGFELATEETLKFNLTFNRNRGLNYFARSDSIKMGQAGTEAYALHIGEMLALAAAGGASPFIPQMTCFVLFWLCRYNATCMPLF